MKGVSVLALTGLCLSLAACGGKGESDESATASAAASAVASAVASGAGLSISTGDLPVFVVLPPDAKALHRMNVNDDNQKGGVIVVETGQSAGDALAFYREQFAKNGMKIALESATGDGAMLAGATEDQAKTLNILVSPGEDGKTNVTITHSEKAA